MSTTTSASWLNPLRVSMPAIPVDDWLKKSGAEKPSWSKNDWSRVRVLAAHRA